MRTITGWLDIVAVFRFGTNMSTSILMPAEGYWALKMSNGLKISGETPSRTSVNALNCASRSQFVLPMSQRNVVTLSQSLEITLGNKLVNTSPMHVKWQRQQGLDRRSSFRCKCQPVGL